MSLHEFKDCWERVDRYTLRKYSIDGEDVFLIIEESSESVLVIEDHDVMSNVARKMIEAGVRVVNE